MSTPAGLPGATARGGPRLPRVPLRITLVAMLLVLVALALVATGVTATSLLKRYLVAQLDQQLEATVRDAISDDRILAGCYLGGRQRYVDPDSYLACVVPGEDDPIVLNGPLGTSHLPDLDAEDVEEIADDAATAWGGPRGESRPPGEGGPPESTSQTVASGDGDTKWLVTAERMPGGLTLVVGGDLDRDDRVIARLVYIEIVVGLVVLVALGLTGYWLVRSSLRPLTEVERTAQAIAAGDLSQRVPAGDDRTEVGRLSQALNGMLARIEAAFRSQQASEEQARASEERMRRFIADASHELRTPLTSIRGFAELYRQGAVGSPEEVARLMQRIESEGGRMGVLVEDLLQLARLDQQRPLSIAPVDLAEVAGDTVHDARVLQPGRPVGLHLDDSLTEVPVVLGDEARLRQVVGNLVTNALVHTPETAPVTVSIGEDTSDGGDRVVLRVTDEGPGMAPEDAARVFERFFRADASRSRRAGGTGLGLSIVASLVAAHGGDVHLHTAPGRGATFTVRLPRSGPDLPGGGPGSAPGDDADGDRGDGATVAPWGLPGSAPGGAAAPAGLPSAGEH
ncbi:HAMP domain-containing sensor histidine kinase [Geodermatophilus aquaeductus]|uniref:histidine kinase n=1 Tax=Geodermatophilus aquaeductus TaxID=1564161 RepID=A0A521AUH2_9ACTN|nr:HAMP domain-containing sensor histidine kinase [Geodermatophilus aquaeductus]SMO38435.1 two-component system, OmpR family, sensor kinase [Geodermatophilus aquaeductus]